MSKTIRSENLDNIILVFLLIKDAFDNIRYICICLQISLYILCLDVKFCNENRIEWEDSVQHVQKYKGLKSCEEIVSLYVG